ncbi:MAG: DNA recombination protein RmuC [Propionibacteriaceae bacterium]|jgi:DNA recombination protein RmuC|nr:DNA recombination protein RmuC [Propionibacteriaceae bacterium]
METYWIVIAAAAALLVGLALGYLLANSRRHTGDAAVQERLTAAQVAEAEARRDAEALRGVLEQTKAAQSASEADALQLRSVLETERLTSERLGAELRASQLQVEQTQAQAQQQIEQAQRHAEERVQEALKSAREQVESIKADREAMQNAFKALSEASIEEQTKKAELAAADRERRTEQVLAPVKENLGRLQEELGKVQQQRATLDAELKAQVSIVQTTGQRLGEQTNALATALRKPQTRGAWGELQLQNVVEAAGMKEHVDFNLQFSSTNDEGKGVRPDMRVELGEGRFVFVDSKVPMEAFLDALELEDETRKREALNRVSKHVKAHIDGLSAKNYFTSDSGTPEFVVLFIPHEAMAAEALYNDSTLYDYSFSRNVVLATPTTLVAMLKAIRYSWQQNDLAENAQKIADVAAQLYQRTGKLAEKFETLGKNLGRTVDSFNGTIATFEGAFLPSARKMHQLGVGDKTKVLNAPSPVQTPVRDPRPAEIVTESSVRRQLPARAADPDGLDEAAVLDATTL